jgi:hypothetical protein
MHPLRLFPTLLLLPACHVPEGRDEPGNTVPEAMVIIEPSDAPWVNILEPTAMQAYEASDASLAVAGEAAETTVSVAWTNDAAGTSGEAQGSSEWAMTLALVEGLHSYTFTATDTAGREGSASLEILYQPGVTMGRPWLSTPVAMTGEAVDLAIDIDASGTVTNVAAVFDCDVDSFELPLAEAGAGRWQASLDARDGEQTCVLHVQASVDDRAVRSLALDYKVREPLSDERIDELMWLHDDLGLLVTEHAGTPAEAFGDAVAELERRDDISMAGWTDQALWWLTRDDLMFSITAAAAEATAGGGSSPPPPMPGSGYPPGLGMGVSPAHKISAFMAIDQPGEHTEFLTGDQGGYACGEWDVNERCGAQATVDNLHDVLQEGIVFIQAHGEILAPDSCARGVRLPYWWHCGAGQGPFAIWTNDVVDKAFITANQADIQAHNLVVDQRIQEDGPHFDTVDPYEQLSAPLVTPGWFAHHVGSGDLDDAVVLMESCSSSKNSSLADVLGGKGAQAYVGFTDVVFLDYSEVFLNRLLETWFDGRTLAEAFEAGLAAVEGRDDDTWYAANVEPVTDAPTIAYPRAFASYDLPTFGSLVLNGGFEEGSSYWQTGGTAEITNAAEGYTADEGDRMLHLELDPYASVGFAWATQWVGETLPAGPYTLSFRTRILTEYSNVDCSNGSDPWFTARLDPGGWTDIPNGGEILDLTVPSDFCDDVVNDGWLFVSGWIDNTIQFELAEEMSADAFITFTTGTSYWEEHHILIDEVKLYEGACGS